MTRWTAEQREAITARDCNLLVSAAAGAGKTAVLVERIVRLLCDSDNPVEIDRLLVVTFTEAAALEMRERIGEALQREIEQDQGGKIEQQLQLLHGANISTLHSFCLDVIRRYFYMTDTDPSFKVADGHLAMILQLGAVQELLEERFAAGEQAFLKFAAMYGGTANDGNLSSIILELYHFTRSNPWPRRWLEEAAAMFAGIDGVPDLSRWLAPLRRYLRRELGHSRSLLARAAKLSSLPGAPGEYRDILLEDISKLDDVSALMGGPWEAQRSGWQALSFKPLPPARDADREIKEEIRALRDKSKAIISDSEEMFFKRSERQFAEEISELRTQVQILSELVLDFGRRYEDEKKRLCLLDFNDLEHHCLRILLDEGAPPGQIAPSFAALELRGSFDYVLVDEYQDINPVQDAILELVSRREDGPNMFMVGDVKQSIYRFRLAEPGLFLARSGEYSDDPDSDYRRLFLTSNFRCRKEIVSAVNFVFGQLMSAPAAEIAYEGNDELVYGARYPENFGLDVTVEINLVDKKATDDSEDDDGSLSALEREARVVAGRILELAGGGTGATVFDKSGISRPLMYSDIVVLMRSTTGRANEMVDIFKTFGIPCHAELSSGYFDATEVQTMISLLKVIDNPCQDIPLAAVLRSPLVALDSEDLGRIAAQNREGDFFEAVKAAAYAGMPGLSERLGAFLARLDRWRDTARREKLSALIARIYSETGFSDYVGGMPYGAQRQANMRALYDRACQFDRYARAGLYRFLKFIRQMQESGEDLGAAKPLGEKENVVRIMSIHKAKGLEFPVVFVVDTGKRFNMQDFRRDMLFHRKLGLGPVIVDLHHRVRYPSLPCHALRLQGEAETRAEEMRILYVAMTRAREKLILVGSTDIYAFVKEKWRHLREHEERTLPAAEVARGQSCLDWLGMALARHSDITGESTYFPDNGGSRFSLRIWGGKDGECLPEPSGYDTPPVIANELLQLKPLDVHIPAELAVIAAKQLHFHYPGANLASLPAKVSVSEAKSRIEGNVTGELFARPWEVPAFISGKGERSPRELGNLYHSVMQHLDLNEPVDKAGIRKQLKKLGEERLCPAEIEGLDASKIASFFTSFAGELVMANRTSVHREWPFTMPVPAALLHGDDAGSETVLVQGVIDLVAVLPDGCIIVDYKTDQVKPGEEVIKSERYRQQLRLYAMAVSGALGLPVKAAFIYYFSTTALVEVVNLHNLTDTPPT